MPYFCRSKRNFVLNYSKKTDAPMVYNSGTIKMKKCFVVFSALVLIAFCSCNKITLSGNNITKEFSIEGSYTELVVENAFDVTVSDAVSQITVTTDENVMPKVVVEKDGDKLKIHLKPLSINFGTDLELKVVLPYNADLTSVDLSGASEFYSEYGLAGETVEVELSGASDFYCDIEADTIDMDLSGASNVEGTIDASELDLEMSGASDATLRGQVTTLDLDLSGASSIKETISGSSYGFECDFCNGEMSGSSDAYIHCNLMIKVDLSGASDLHYTGNASTTDSTTSGGSNISHDVLP